MTKSQMRVTAFWATRPAADAGMKVANGSEPPRSGVRAGMPESAQPSPSPRDPRRSAIHTGSSHSTYTGGPSVLGQTDSSHGLAAVGGREDSRRLCIGYLEP